MVTSQLLVQEKKGTLKKLQVLENEERENHTKRGTEKIVANKILFDFAKRNYFCIRPLHPLDDVF